MNIVKAIHAKSYFKRTLIQTLNKLTRLAYKIYFTLEASLKFPLLIITALKVSNYFLNRNSLQTSLNVKLFALHHPPFCRSILCDACRYNPIGKIGALNFP